MGAKSMEKMFIDFLKENLKSRKFEVRFWAKHLRELGEYKNVAGVEIVSEFLSRNIIAIGWDWDNYHTSQFRITEYGVKFLEEN